MKNRKKMLSQLGFTLIELLITVAISGILMAGVYTAFISQQNSYLAQEQVAEVQQNIRAGLDVMVRDMRMAGYDPDSSGAYGIAAANNSRFEFTLDDPDNPGTALSIAYDLYAPGHGGVALGRSENSGLRNSVAEDIESLEFFYVLDDGTEVLAPTSAQLEDIRSVQISILASARQPDRNYTHTDTYTTASGVTWTPPNDNLRRRFQVMTVQLRNMGL
jgi:type IV pilus assembly protein PilW